ncbi:hypothetical protein BH09SUM1_BH09SUM1_07860 [soil metagenome]
MTKAVFRVSERDYVRASRLGTARWVWTVCAWICPILILLNLALSDPSLVSLLSPVPIAVGMGVILNYIVMPIMFRLNYRKFKAMHQEFTVELLDEGIRTTTAMATSLLVWDTLLKWRHNDEFIIIFLAPRHFFPVPKSISSQGFDVNLLQQRLFENLGKSK